MAANPTIEMTTDVQKQVKDLVGLLTTRPITEEIAIQVELYEGFEHLEIVDGEWVGLSSEEDEYVGGEEHGTIEFRLLLAIGNYVVEHKLGRVYPGDTDFVLQGTPQNIKFKRRPDVSFVSEKRVKKTKGYIYASPDLAIEVISPTERPGPILKKLSEYLTYNVKQVWHVYPAKQEVIVYLPDGSSQTHKSGDTLTGGDVLPGFSLAVADLFK
jgi:Uma2 family endonuclease